MTIVCDEDALRALTTLAARSDAEGLAESDRLLDRYPDDPRLHFLRGSLLAAMARLIEAHAALSRAVTLAPDFVLARFQLGLFELTSGEPGQALATWAPLDALPDDHCLALFVGGLRHLIRDEFDAAIELLNRGIAHNHDNPPLSRDMQLLIDRCREATAAEAPGTSAETVSATSMLLGQLGAGTVH